MSQFNYAESSFYSQTQIRLLTLLPPRQLSPENLDQPAISISTSLEAVNWKDKPPYVALSYAWGDPTLLKTVLVNDQTLEITVNLHEALRQLQTAQPVRLWVDAICINQKDDSEKSDQVKQMKGIYKDATAVFAWLGPAADDSDVAMGAIERIGEAALTAGVSNLSREVMLKLWDPDPEGALDGVRKPLLDLSKNINLDFPLAAIKSLSERNYWNRTWIVQEFSVASTLIIACGPRRLEFPRLGAALQFLQLHHALMGKTLYSRILALDIQDPMREVEMKAFQNWLQNSISGAPNHLIGSRSRYQKQRPDYHSSLLELLGLLSKSTQATNPRDKIYGLLGLAPDAPELAIQVDYGRKVDQVFTDTAKALLQHDFTDVLSWCRFPKLQPDLPSWVPDFNAALPDPLASYKCRAPPWKPLFSASGSSKVKISNDNNTTDTRLLTISGLIVDTIEELGTTYKVSDNETASMNIFFDEVVECWNRAQKLQCPVSTDPQFWEEALWRVPCADQQRHDYAHRRATLEAQDGLLEILNRIGGERSGYRDEVKAAAWQRYYLAMQCLYDFRPFLSKKGYIGLAPEFAAPGDTICVILGAIAPYVLRKISDGGFKLVGEAYVHGIMDGEAMDMGLDEEEFCLS
jgi:hypothetical protein